MIQTPSIFGALKDLVQNAVFNLTGSGAPVNGAAGSGAGFAGPGSSYVDIASGLDYTNTGTAALPIWNIADIQYAKALYDFTTDGGAIGLITPAINFTLPNKAIIIGGILDVVTTFVGATATISIGTSAGSSATSLKAATAVATYAAGLLATVPVFTAATSVKLTASGVITLTIATAPLTVAKLGIHLAYVVGD